MKNNNSEMDVQIKDENVAANLDKRDCLEERPLPLESEEELCSCLKTTDWGKTATKIDVINLVTLYVDENKGKNSSVGKHLEKFCNFVNNRPNEEWLDDYLKRYNLTLTSEETSIPVVESDSNDNKVTSSASNIKLSESKIEKPPKKVPKLETSEPVIKRERRSIASKGDDEVYKFSISDYESLQKSIEVNNYYAVYYGDGIHYVGLVTAKKKSKLSMKFLHKKPTAKSLYDWPKQDDVDHNIDPVYVFLGPIKVEGEAPFKIMGLAEATKEYCKQVEEA